MLCCIRSFASNALSGVSSARTFGSHCSSTVTVSAEDFLDDGTPLRLAVTVDEIAGSALFDFQGTGPEVLGNLNAPPAVTASAVIYCMRCLLVDMDIPLNQVA